MPQLEMNSLDPRVWVNLKNNIEQKPSERNASPE